MTDPAAPAGAAGLADARARPSLVARACAPVDAAALAAFRIVFGAVVAYGALRFMANGWIESLFVAPRFHFKYYGFDWVEAWPRSGMYLHFGVLVVLGLLVAIGLFYRAAIVLLFLAFTYIELIDVTTYLNHYYLVSLLALLLCCLPANVLWSLDAWRKPHIRRATVPALSLFILRFQVGVVYVFAGLAKLGSDWLLRAQPLDIWLTSRRDFPLVGSVFAEPWAAYAMSWAGFLFDSTIVLWLCIPKTRIPAFLAVIGFHCMTGALFPIGLFPVIMVSSALIFFPADWPRRLAALRPTWLGFRTTPKAAGALEFHGKNAARVPRFGRWLVAAACAYAALQVLIPLRHRLYGGNVLWDEQGMRWSWKVMVREKNGAVTFMARSPSRNRTFHVSPRRYLTSIQEREMSGQPDLILQLAHRIRDDYRVRGYEDIQVHADALASLNGRPAARLIDPDVDLGRIRDGHARADWILDLPSETPPRPSAERASRARGSAPHDPG